MFHLLQRHPFAVEAHFQHVLVLTYAYPPDLLAPLVPPGLTLDTFDGWGFLAVAMVQTHALRPAFLPRGLGRSFFLAGYRVFVRHRDASGRMRRGLRILRSDTDRRSMVFFGNLLTHYNYRRAAVCLSEAGQVLEVRVETSDGAGDLHVVAQLDSIPAALPPESPFHDVEQARRFAGPLPYTFDHEPQTNSIIRIQATRTVWKPQPIRARVLANAFVKGAPFSGTETRLASAFYVRDIDYRWERGVREPLVMKSPSVSPGRPPCRV